MSVYSPSSQRSPSKRSDGGIHRMILQGPKGARERARSKIAPFLSQNWLTKFLIELSMPAVFIFFTRSFFFNKILKAMQRHHQPIAWEKHRSVVCVTLVEQIQLLNRNVSFQFAQLKREFNLENVERIKLFLHNLFFDDIQKKYRFSLAIKEFQ